MKNRGKYAGYARAILALTISLLLTVSGMPVIAAMDSSKSTVEAYNAQVRDKANAIAKKYGVSVTYPIGMGYAGIGTATLATLDACLEYVTAPVMKELSEWYKEKNGTKLTFAFTNSPNFSKVGGSHPVAGFTRDRALIEIYVPRTNNPGALLTGNSPTAIIHEVGHAVHDYLIARVGSAKLKEQWTKLNGSSLYDSAYSYDRNVFVSQYASTSYDEDFADTFAHGYVCNRAGFSIAKNLKINGINTILGSKIALLETLIASGFSDAEGSLKNLKKCWSTPESLLYSGYKFSGSSMEYVGYNAPYGVLNATLKKLGITEKSAGWQRTLGGWVVTDTKGGEYAVFPGGAYTVLKKAG